MNSRIDRLPVLVLEPHARCNCRCVMCDIWKITDSRELSAGELERHLGDIERLGVEWTVFTGGEPLMHSDLFRLSRMLRARRIRTTILSSGLLLARHAEAIVADVDDVIVSLDGPPPVHNEIRGVPNAFDLLAKGIRAIHGISPGYSISARCTVQSRNAGSLCGAIETARGLGLRSISFLAADLSSPAFNRPTLWSAAQQSAIAPELSILETELDAIAADTSNAGFVLESPAKLRRIAAHFRAHHGLGSHSSPRCNAPWVSAVVETNGDVRPCFFHPPIGNTAEGTLAEVLNGTRALSFRESLNVAEDPVCRRCVCSLYVDEPATRNGDKELTRPAVTGRTVTFS